MELINLMHNHYYMLPYCHLPRKVVINVDVTFDQEMYVVEAESCSSSSQP